ncbi:GumC family protein [Mongoliimonas terrestris]|uniref:GumC family protein n=1 Tax=Mongoliimonas terrestris TaxID=1709001 RepID=UPI000A94D044|nr:exopolysaccharide transport family protein [Mongoliimonas terrestris]
MIGSIQQRPPYDDDGDLDLSRGLRAVWRRRKTVLATTALVSALAFAALSLTPATYRAETRIRLEPQDVAATAGIPAPSQSEMVDSQIQLLTSRDLARRVAEMQSLVDRPDFDGADRSLLARGLSAAGFGGDPNRVSPEERVLDSLMRQTEVFAVEGSRVLVLRIASGDPALAASVANAMAEEYMALQAEAKPRPVDDHTVWLATEIEGLKAKIRRAEGELAKVAAGEGIGAVDPGPVRRQIADLAQRLSVARAEHTDAEARAARLAGVVEARGDLSEAADILDGGVYPALRAREVELRNRLSELSVTLLPGHPQVRAVQSQLADIEVQQAAEARRTLATLQAEALAAAGRVATLDGELSTLKAEAAAIVDPAGDAEQRALEREIASERAMLASLETRYLEATARQSAPMPPVDVRILSRATAPAEPIGPKVLPLTGLAGLAGFLGSIGWILSAEALRLRARRRSADLPATGEAAADHPVGEPVEVPAAVAPGPMADGALDRSTDDRVARFRAAVALAASERAAAHPPAAEPAPAPVHAPRAEPAPAAPVQAAGIGEMHAVLVSEGTTRVGITGAVSADGVERVVAGFSQLAAEEGSRVVVVDTVAAHAGREGPGLSDLLAGTSAFDDIIRRNPATRAHEIGVGSRPLASEVFAGEAIATVLTALEHTYDVVVLDFGLIEPDPNRFSLLATADLTILVGDADDPDVVRIHDLMIRSGIAPVSIIPVPAGESVGEAA